MRLDPAVEIGQDAGGTFTVELDAGLLFRGVNGTVRNLAALDFDETGRVPDLDVRVKDGLTRIRFER